MLGLLLAGMFILPLASCGDDDDKGGSSKLEAQTFTVGGVTFKMMPVEGGTFLMGSPEADSEADSDEKPQHEVTVGDFFMGSTEVTQKLWKAVMGSNPSKFEGDDLPVEYVSWNDCQTFLVELNAMKGTSNSSSYSGWTFRLPTEAEWEYAARGGEKSKGYKYSGSDDIASVAWYMGNSDSKTHAVGTKKPNELGLYDMSGNVSEWCLDWYASDYYSKSPYLNPCNNVSASSRALRGGNWGSNGKFFRIAYRSSYSPANKSSNYGLRLVLAP